MNVNKYHLMARLSVIAWLFCMGAPAAAQPQLPLDYSSCGYRQSDDSIPAVPVAFYVDCAPGDQYARVQQAIDYVASLKPDRKSGLRGAVLLGEGTFLLSQPLRIGASGVVLRGADKHATVLRKTGPDRGALVYIEGTDDRRFTDTVSIDTYLPAGATDVPRLSGSGSVLIVRPSTKEWIAHLGCDTWGGGSRLGYWAWHPGEIDIVWDRDFTASDSGGKLSSPITTAIDPKWGGGYAVGYVWPGRVADCGVENLTLESDYDTRRPADEDHCWDGISIDCARDCWVRMVSFRHFAGSAVIVGRHGSRVTVEDCVSLQPVSEIGGMRRRTFFTLGGQTLFQRCYSEHGINDFAAGQCAPGPNAFVQCDSYESFGPSGSIGPWASGLLFDGVNIDGHDLRFSNLGLEKYGAGWNTANSTFWQCTAAGIDCFSPDSDAVCIAYGCWAQFQGNGVIEQTNEHVKPVSIFEHQLSQRLGRDVSARCRLLIRDTNASSSPTIDEALQMAREALAPRLTLSQWIEQARLSAPTVPGKSSVLCVTRAAAVIGAQLSSPVLREGRLVDSLTGALLTGGRHNSPWWNGRLRYSATDKATYAITRFVPGSEALGTTTRIDSVVAAMTRSHTLMYAQNYGLWYDRRRDDHERVRRKDGDVWGPFYEQPFRRTGGSQRAWDGLSKYDLTQLNTWYFHRLREFADKGRASGLLLTNQHYFQHNILEAGAHWVDCPWRTSNNVNSTPFLEPVNFTGDKRIFTAQLFYDVSNPTLRQLHRQYIRQSLDAFKDQPNVIHSIGEEFTGPLHFVRFWLDCIAEWESETGRDVMVMLGVNRDVQDSILADGPRAAVVDIINIEQWFYHNKGEYAPPGGVNMAPRQYQRKIRTGSARFEDVYRAVSEYRARFPEKAVVYYAQKYPELAWAVLMAGGSCPAVSASDPELLASIAAMSPVPAPDSTTCAMASADDGARLYFKTTDAPLQLSLPSAAYVCYKVDAATGSIARTGLLRSGDALKGKGIYWLRRK